MDKNTDETIGRVYTDTAFSAIKNSVYSNFITPFALALNATNQYVAIIATLPDLIGSFFQLFSADMLNIVKSRKKIIIWGAALDAFLWLPILLIPFIWQESYVLLLNFLIIRAIIAYVVGTSFSSLLGDMVPQHKRGQIFSRINQISGGVSFFTAIISGAVLAFVPGFWGFALIFTIAGLTRAVSAYIRTKYHEPITEPHDRNMSIIKFTRQLKKTNFGMFVLYSSFIRFAVGIASPFFTVYMLEYLKMGYLEYSIINAASIVSSFLVLNRWGRDIDAKGSKWMLGISGLLIPVVPILWILFKSSVALFMIQLFSGAVWSAYNLSNSNFVLDATTRKNRLLMSSFHNFFIGVMTFLGAIIGGSLMRNVPGNIFYFVFGLSGILRLVFSLYFLPQIKEERFVNIKIKGPKAKRIISLIPNQGVIYNFIPRKKN